jgi:hypothetical protein
MNTNLESELRDALRERASLVPDASAVRIARFDYRPRTGGPGAPLAFKAVGASAAAAGAAVAIASLGTGAAPAFAGWTAKPTAPLPGQLANANTDCRANSPIPGLPLKLSDTRGPYTFSVYANDTSSATCITGPSVTSVSGSVASAAQVVPSGQISLSSSHRTDRGGNPFSFAEGRTGDGVSAVTLILDDGTSIDATVANGWFVAWWPSLHQVSSAEITTPTGANTQTFPRLPNPPSGTSGASFSSGGGTATGKHDRVESFDSSR